MVAFAKTQHDRVRALNDRLRQTGTGGTIMATPGVRAMGVEAVAAILQAIAVFDTFDRGNDPYGEHDFGSVVVDGQRVLFKIDAYDLDLRWQSPDPADPNVTRRVMTVMLPEEY